jgi:hypothetical protein
MVDKELRIKIKCNSPWVHMKKETVTTPVFFKEETFLILFAYACSHPHVFLASADWPKASLSLEQHQNNCCIKKN